MAGFAERDYLGSSVADDAALADALLGGGLPSEAERHLRLAALSYHLDDVAEQHLLDACATASGHPAVLIGLYRYYFYKGKLHDALDVAVACLECAARENDLPPNWRQTRATDAHFDRYEEILPRFFLFTLKGYAYLNLRLGNIAEGRLAVEKLLELDATDKVGATVLLEVIERVGRDDDD